MKIVRWLIACGAAACGWFATGEAACAHETSGERLDALQPKVEKRRIAEGVALALVDAPADKAATCKLSIRLEESKSGKPLAGLVRISDANGKALKPVGLVSHGLGLPENNAGREWYAVLDQAEAVVPQTAVRIEAISGLETERASSLLDLQGRERAEVKLSLTRFADAAAQDWRAGNTHLHLRYLTRGQSEQYLRTLPVADGLEMLFVSHLRRAGEDVRYITNDFSPEEIRKLGEGKLVFGWGQELRHNFGAGGEGYGHVLLLNLRRLIEPVSIGPGIAGDGHDHPPLRAGILETHRVGGSVIWCHNAFGYEDVPAWLAGLVHAQNIFDGGTRGDYAESFYRYLNYGLRVPFSTGTDWFLYDFARVYVRHKGPLTERTWLAALEQGRSYITNGPLLKFSVNHAQIGDTIAVDGSKKLTIRGRAQGRIDFVGLELVHNGQVLARSASRPVIGHFEADLTHEISTAEAGWLCLRIPVRADAAKDPAHLNECGETLFAHTSPIYLSAGGKLRRDPAAGRALLDDLARARAEIAAKAKFATNAQRIEILKVYDEAEAKLLPEATPR